MMVALRMLAMVKLCLSTCMRTCCSTQSTNAMDVHYTAICMVYKYNMHLRMWDIRYTVSVCCHSVFAMQYLHVVLRWQVIQLIYQQIVYCLGL